MFAYVPLKSATDFSSFFFFLVGGVRNVSIGIDMTLFLIQLKNSCVIVKVNFLLAKQSTTDFMFASCIADN